MSAVHDRLQRQLVLTKGPDQWVSIRALLYFQNAIVKMRINTV